MPDHVIILLIFAVLSSFGIVWLANELRLRYPARYLEYNFYFILSALCYGFVNWILPFAVLYLAESAGDASPDWFVVIFVLIAVPILLAKLYFLFLFFQELMALDRPAWFNRFSFAASLAVLLLSIWFIKVYFDDLYSLEARGFLLGMGLLTVLLEWFIIVRYIVLMYRVKNRVIGKYSLVFGYVFLGGFTIYVLMAYSAFLPAAGSLVELTPYLYIIIHGLPLIVLWLFHQNEPVAVLNTDQPRIEQFISGHSLTVKEADILKQIIRGASNREIAEHSHISPNTVRNHIYNIYNKTGIRNRFQLLALCQQDQKSLVD